MKQFLDNGPRAADIREKTIAILIQFCHEFTLVNFDKKEFTPFEAVLKEQKILVAPTF